MKRILAGAFIGALIGAALVLALLANRMDDLYIMNKQLLLEQSENRDKVKILEDKLQQYHKLIIVGIDFKYDTLPDSLERVSLEREMRQVVRSLIGQEVRDLKPDTVIALLENRLLVISDNSYKLQVRAIVLTERVTFYLKVAPHTGEPEDDEP